jgi:hypothetical protein
MGRPQIILTSTNKTASFKVFVVCGWREEAVAGVCLCTYLVHSTYVFLVKYQGNESRKNCKPSCSWFLNPGLWYDSQPVNPIKKHTIKNIKTESEKFVHECSSVDREICGAKEITALKKRHM